MESGRVRMNHDAPAAASSAPRPAALIRRALAGELRRLEAHGAGGRRRTLLPQAIQGVALQRREGPARGLRLAGEAGGLSAAAVPRVVAQARRGAAVRAVGTVGTIRTCPAEAAEPRLRRVIADVEHLHRRRHGLAGLDVVAPVHEEGGILGENDGPPRRAAESGQPQKALRAGGDILALMLVRPSGQRTQTAPPRPRGGAERPAAPR